MFNSSVIKNNYLNSPLNFKEDSISEMKNYIFSLEKKIKEEEFEMKHLKNTISNLEQNKLSLIQELDKKESIINEITNSYEKLKNESKQNKSKINELESENRSLNYSNIELTQRNKSLFSTKESIMKNKEIIPNQLIEIQNQLDENEIMKNKLEFDNRKLINKINDLQNEFDNEINLLNKIKNGEIQQLQKTILNLDKELKLNLQKNNFHEQNKTYNNNQSLFLIEQFSSFENKIKELNDLVFTLEKDKKNLMNKIKEYEIEIEHKDKFIQELKIKVDDSENVFNQKLNELKINHNDNIIEVKETENEIEKLI